MINLIIVEDHTLFREGIKSLLSNFNDMKVVAEFANGKEFCDHLSFVEADIVLMDIEMPLMNGLIATQKAKELKPELQIIALSMYSDQKYYYEMIKAGISGFVLKEASTIELEKAIRDVYSGLGFFSPKILQKTLVNIHDLDNKKNKLDELQLTEREIEVLELICQGLSNNEISDKLCLSAKTIESHKSKLFLKTNTKNTAALIIYAIKNDLIKL
jgi:DNA-binding NarL/FixJ family response regulator